MLLTKALFSLVQKKSVPIHIISRYDNKLYSTRIPEDEKLLVSILREEEESQKQKAKSGTQGKLPSLGPKYWKSQFTKSYKKINKGIENQLDAYVNNNLEVIKNFNKKHKKSIEQRIKVDLTKSNLTFRDFFPNNPLLRAILQYIKTDQPTDFQKRFFSLMSGYISTIAKGNQGSGRSLSIILSALFLRRSPMRGPGINSLVIVKSNEILLQYEKIITDIFSNLENPTSKTTNMNKIVQFLYRGSPDEEIAQQDILGDYPTPHILVTTPHRLLDLLSSRGMDYVKINSLSFIAVDDFDALIDAENYLDVPRKAPVVALLDYALKLQDYRRSHNEPHPQIVLTVSETCTDELLEQIKEKTKWFDWNKFSTLGSFRQDQDVPYYKYIPSNVGVSSVLVKPRPIGNKYKISLYDMIPFSYGEELKDWMNKLYRSMQGNDFYYKKHRNVKRNKMGIELKKFEIDALCSGLSKLWKKSGLKEQIKNKKVLVVYPDEFSSSFLEEILMKKTGKKARIFNARKDLTFFEDDLIEGETQILMINTSALTGLTFKGLDTIFVLGLDSIKSLSNFITILGRMRNKKGIIESDKFMVFAQQSNDKIENKVYILNSTLDFEYMERNFLERLYIESGLVKQFQIVGVEEIGVDKEDYEEQFAVDYTVGSNDFDFENDVEVKNISTIKPK